jgi:hypothetical protein
MPYTNYSPLKQMPMVKKSCAKKPGRCVRSFPAIDLFSMH